MKRSILFLVLLSFFLGVGAQQREIHILSVNDVHAQIDNMPQLAAIVDSLRSIDPELLVIAAGDNRTGNPINDQYEPTSYPMTALMNFIGFDCTGYGNHEFDSGVKGLAKVIDLSNFPHVNANAHPDPSLGIHQIPYKIFNIDGISIGILGVVQLGTHGYPDTHPDNVKGITFTDPAETIKQYEWLAKKCDVNILLSHLGYEDDLKMAAQFPYYDLIISSHSHTQLKGGELHNGVLITQNTNKLKRCTYTTLTVEDGKVVKKEAVNIEVETYPRKNLIAEELVRFFNDNEFFQRELAMAETPFTSPEELGVLLCDAIKSEANADFALWNAGGVRLEKLDEGPITVNKVLQLDPFGNMCVEMNLTGKELEDILFSCYQNDQFIFPFTSGNLMSTVSFDPNDKLKIQKMDIRTSDGKKLNAKKIYKVVTNSYTASITDAPRKDQGRDLNIGTSDMVMKYLEKKGSVDYLGRKCQQILNRE